MIYLIIGVVLIIIMVVALKRSAKKINTPDNIITYFYQALELEYFLLNPESTLDPKVLDKALLTTSGFFYSNGKSVEVKLSLDEIIAIAEHATEEYEHRADRLGYFIINFIVAQSFKENHKQISVSDNSDFLMAVDEYDGRNEVQVMQRHLKDKQAPVGHQVLTKRLIKDYPNWVELQFDQ